MYIEIKTDEISELLKAVEAVIRKGQHYLLTLSKDGDFWSLSINEVSPEPQTGNG